MKKILLIGSLLACALSFARERETLAVWMRDVMREDEYPQSDSDNPYDPDYLSFYKEKDPNFFGLLLVRFGLAEPLWNPFDIVPQLKRITALRKTKIKKRPYFEDLVVEKGARIVLFGSLHGALHSTVRDIAELKRLGIIDERLQLVDPSTYLVFLGEVINGTPYSLLLIELILTLIEKNPGKVFYLRGSQETKGNWTNYFALRSQLKRWAYFWGSGEGLPLANELNELFATFPDGLIIHHKNDVRERLVLGNYASKVKPTGEVDIQAYIVGERPLQSLKELYGLDFRGFDKGVATWSLLSSPTLSYQSFLKFTDDTFAILSIKDKLRDSLISVYYQNARKKNGFYKENYVASLGLEIKKGEAEKEYPTLMIGSSMALTGGLSLIGKSVKRGLEVELMHANELGGVKGMYLKPLVLDDAYDPRRVLTSLKKLERWYGITTLVAPQGSPTLAAYIDQVKAGTCEVFFPITGGPQFRTPDNKHIVHFRADYGQEASDLINYTIKQFNSKKFVLMYQNDAFGIPLVEAAHKALERHGITEWVDIPFLREQTTFDDAVKKVLQSDPDALGLFFSSSSLARTFLSKVGSSFFVNKHLFTTAFLEDESFRLFLKSTGIMMTFSFVVPNPWGSELEIVQEYRAEMQKQQASLGCNSLEGYVAGAIFVEALKQIDQPYTGARARAFMETMHNYPLRGLSLTFNPADRGFNLPIWIRGEDGEWVK